MLRKAVSNMAKPLQQQTASEQKVFKSESFFYGAMRRLFQHKLAVTGIVIVGFFVTIAVFSNQLSVHSITSQNLRNRFAPPTFSSISATGTAISNNYALTSISNGEIYARDANINIPRWHQNLNEPVNMAPIVAGQNVYLGTEKGILVAFELASGTQLWTMDAGGEIKNLWQIGEDVLILDGDSNLSYLDSEGNPQWITELSVSAVAMLGSLSEPLILTGEGELYRFNESGQPQLLTSVAVAPEMAYVLDDVIYIYGNGELFRHDLTTESSARFYQFDRDLGEPLAMVGFDSTLVLSFAEGFTFAVNLETNERIWSTTLNSEILSFAYDGSRAIHGVARNGRLMVFNPSTGGITSSRMVEGYSDVHYLGTDELGRDAFSRILAGGRVSLSLGFVVSIMSVILGSLIGAMAGYFGGWIDSTIMRVVDFMLAIPRLPLLMIVSYILGPSFTTMVIVLVMFGWLGICRIVRSQTLSLKQQDFVQASRALGVSTPRIIVRHILPNTVGPIIVAATLAVGNAILAESQLSYLGLGIQPPTPSWGNMLMNSRQYLTTAPWLAIWPGLCIFLVLLGFNFIGDGLRDAFDPKLKGR